MATRHQRNKLVHKILVLGDNNNDIIQYFGHQKYIKLSHPIDGVEKQHEIYAQLFDTLQDGYYDVDCAIISYDISKQQSFETVQHWISKIHTALNIRYTQEKIAISIAGNQTRFNSDPTAMYTTFEEMDRFCHNKYLSCNKYYQIEVGNQKCITETICNGYIRMYNDESQTIPKDIYNVCLKFFNVEPSKSIIKPYKICTETGQGIDEMIKDTIRTRLDIDHYHPIAPFLNKKENIQNQTGLLSLVILVIVTVLFNNFYLGVDGAA